MKKGKVLVKSTLAAMVLVFVFAGCAGPTPAKGGTAEAGSTATARPAATPAEKAGEAVAESLSLSWGGQKTAELVLNKTEGKSRTLTLLLKNAATGETAASVLVASGVLSFSAGKTTLSDVAAENNDVLLISYSISERAVCLAAFSWQEGKVNPHPVPGNSAAETEGSSAGLLFAGEMLRDYRIKLACAQTGFEKVFSPKRGLFGPDRYSEAGNLLRPAPLESADIEACVFLFPEGRWVIYQPIFAESQAERYGLMASVLFFTVEGYEVAEQYLVADFQ